MYYDVYHVYYDVYYVYYDVYYVYYDVYYEKEKMFGFQKGRFVYYEITNLLPLQSSVAQR